LPQILIVGLPDTSVSESRERVKAALKASGFELPLGRIVVNMAPADLRKEGSYFDLPIAIGVLISSGQLESFEDWWLVGELSLNGDLKPCSGALPIADAARSQGVRRLIVPADNAEEAALIDGVEVYGARSLADVVSILSQPQAQEEHLVPVQDFDPTVQRVGEEKDLKYVKGQFQAKRALEIAAAGGHNLMFIGEPGGGKSMLAQCLSGIMPPPTKEMALEVTKVYSVAGLLKYGQNSVVATRPFRAPHHSTSAAGLIGGGTIPKPGEISLAHNGVLFLDELAEFDKRTLDTLRQPIETGTVTISRARMTVQYPASFLLVSACNPYTGTRKTSKGSLLISAPLWDRFGLIVWVPPLKTEELMDFDPEQQEASETVRARVLVAWQRQLDRFRGQATLNNAHMNAQQVHMHCRFTAEAGEILRQAVLSLNLTGRSYDHVLRTARTIADLSDSDDIGQEHVAEAIQYRMDQEVMLSQA
jgi:magnesium chelatase family protein